MKEFKFIRAVEMISGYIGLPLFCASLFFFLAIIYFLVIGPALYRFWIIPKIEKRYNAKLIFDNPAYMMPFSNWGIPAFEMSGYIIGKFMGWEFLCKNSYAALKKINYDIHTASKAEVLVAFISAFIFISSVISGFIVGIHGK